MSQELFTHLAKPAQWQRSPLPFWDDEHISKFLLEAHLSQDTEAASRSSQTIDRSVDWLSSLIPEGSRILDLGCGPGLYDRRLSAKGYSVTGIDFSRRSIDYARTHDQVTTYHSRNYLTIDFENAFDAVTLIYCDYAALVPDERKQLLQKIFRALRPGGILILDVFTAQIRRGKQERTIWTYHENGGFWNPDPHLCLEARYYYDNMRVQAEKYIVVTPTDIREYIVWDTVYDAPALRDELSAVGFARCELFDDVMGQPYTGMADTMCALARKKIDRENPFSDASKGSGE